MNPEWDGKQTCPLPRGTRQARIPDIKPTKLTLQHTWRSSATSSKPRQLSLLTSGRRHPLPTQNGSMPNATRGQQCFAGGIPHLVQANAHTVPEHCSEQVDASRRVRGCARVGRRHRRRHGRRKQLPVVELVLQVHTRKRARCKDRDPAQRLIYCRIRCLTCLRTPTCAWFGSARPYAICNN